MSTHSTHPTTHTEVLDKVVQAKDIVVNLLDAPSLTHREVRGCLLSVRSLLAGIEGILRAQGEGEHPSPSVPSESASQALLGRLEALEKRVGELESRPAPYPWVPTVPWWPQTPWPQTPWVWCSTGTAPETWDGQPQR